jgi:transcriptional regulator with XRE-family HTH domain
VKPDRRIARPILTNLLKQIRTDAKVSQERLGRLLGRDQTFVSRYESGERRLDILELRDVCMALDLSLEAFCRQLNKRLLREDRKGNNAKSHSA